MIYNINTKSWKEYANNFWDNLNMNQWLKDPYFFYVGY